MAPHSFAAERMVAAQFATTMSQPPKRICTEPRSCNGCEARSKTPCMFGHNQCSLHRPCIGQSYWEPNNCEVCKSLVGRLQRASPKGRSETLNAIEIMLKRCQDKIKEAFPNRKPWEYEPLFFYTFKDFLPTSGGRGYKLRKWSLINHSNPLLIRLVLQ